MILHDFFMLNGIACAVWYCMYCMILYCVVFPLTLYTNCCYIFLNGQVQVTSGRWWSQLASGSRPTVDRPRPPKHSFIAPSEWNRRPPPQHPAPLPQPPYPEGLSIPRQASLCPSAIPSIPRSRPLARNRRRCWSFRTR